MREVVKPTETPNRKPADLAKGGQRFQEMELHEEVLGDQARVLREN